MWDDDEHFAVHVERTWTESADVLCLVYRQPGMYPDMTLGLRRTVDPDWTVEGVADEILCCELGEPLGSLYAGLEADEDGVMWWTGNLPEWKDRR
jgi:hypothetical protein